MHLPFILATALLQEGSGEATKSLGFLIVILLGAPAAWLLFSGKNVPLGVALGIVALIVLWHMAQLPLPNPDRRIFNGDGAFIGPFFASISQRQQRRTLMAGAVIAAICAYMGAWMYIPVILVGIVMSCWPQAKQLPALAIDFVRRSQ